MNVISENGIFEIKIAETFECHENENTFHVYNNSGVGAITIMSYGIPSNYDFSLEKELFEFGCSIDDSFSIQSSQLIFTENGFCFSEFVNKAKEYWLVGVLYRNSYALFATYNCSESDREVEKKIV